MRCARGDQLVASAIQIIGFFFIMGFVGLWAVRVMEMGALGVIVGLNAGMLLTALALGLRYWLLPQIRIAPMTPA